MILKAISTSSSGNLLRYILRAKKTKSKAYEYQNEKVFKKYEPFKNLYVYGVKFSELDRQHLESERVDAQLVFDLKNFKGSMSKFIETLIKSSGNAKLSKEEVAVIHTHNLKSRETAGFEKEFKTNEENRIHKSSRQNAATHFILSWNSKESKITDKMLQSMAKEFVRLRGDTNLYVFTKHVEPGKHVHLHVAMSATKLNGMSSRISKSEFAGIKLSMDAYQREHYGLVHSLPQHGKSKGSKVFDKEPIKNKKIAERSSVKNELLKLAESVNLSTLSSKQFFSLMEKQGYKPYCRNGKMTGLQNENGLKFRFSRLNIDLEKMLQKDATILKEEKSLKNLREQITKVKSRSEREVNQKLSKFDRLEHLKNHTQPQAEKKVVVEQDNKTVELNELNNLRSQTHSEEREQDDYDGDSTEDNQDEDNGQDDQKDNEETFTSSINDEPNSDN